MDQSYYNEAILDLNIGIVRLNSYYESADSADLFAVGHGAF